MADTLTTNIKITQQEVGGNNNSWGGILNTDIETIDRVFGDTTAISTTGGTKTLSETEELVAIIEVSGTLASNSEIVFSGRGGSWIIDNSTSGAYTLTCKVSGQPGVLVGQGDIAIVYCNGTDIAKATTPAVAEEAVASASTCDILGTTSEFVEITGTTTITSLGTGVNKKRFVRFSGSLTLTYNATSLILPGNDDIITQAGDTMIVVSDNSSNARVVSYQRDATEPANDTNIFQTGDMLFNLVNSTRSGFVRCNGRTIGNASSSGTERANADTEALFTYLWDNFSDTYCPVSTGRGASAAADFAANKNIGTPDLRGRSVFGFDDMGNTDTNIIADGRFSSGNGQTNGSYGGDDVHTLSTGELPIVTPTGSTDTIGDHTHDMLTNEHPSSSHIHNNSARVARGMVTGSSNHTDSGVMAAEGDHNHVLTMNAFGSGTAHNNMPPFSLCTWLIKL